MNHPTTIQNNNDIIVVDTLQEKLKAQHDQELPTPEECLEEQAATCTVEESQEDPVHNKPCCCEPSQSTQLVVAVFLGVIVGLLVSLAKPSEEVVTWLGFPGTIFLRVLKCLVTPLIFCNMFTATFDIVSVGSKLGRLFGQTVGLYMLTTLLAVTNGMLIALSFKSYFQVEEDVAVPSSTDLEPQTISDTIMGVLYSIFTDNIFNALVIPDILAVIVFAIFFGLMAGRLPTEEARPNYVVELMSQLTKLFGLWIEAVVKFAPAAVLFMIASSLAAAKDVAVLLHNIGIFSGCVLLGLAIHLVLVLPLLFTVIVRANPYLYLARMTAPLTFAFGCASSAATLPITIETVSKVIPPSIARFVLSLGATINMDGSAVYFPLAIVFLACVSGNAAALTPSATVTLAIMSTIGAVGASPIPNAGLIMILTIWDAVLPGVPMPMQIAYITAIDWLLDRFITSANVGGDTFVARMVSSFATQDAVVGAEEEERNKILQRRVSQSLKRMSVKRISGVSESKRLLSTGGSDCIV